VLREQQKFNWKFRMKRFFSSLLYSEDGQGLVELALVIPILLIVVIGIVDFGRAVNYWNDENHVANLGARYAAVGSTGGVCNGTDYSTSGHTLHDYLVCEATLDSTELANGSGGGTGPQGALNVCISAPTPSFGSQVTVKVSTNYNWLPMPKVLGGSSTFAATPLAGTATMRLEQNPSASVYTTTSPC
jgi:Flp pilus assembly protein TadG